MPDGIFKYDKSGNPAWGVRLKFKHDDGKWRAKTWRGFDAPRAARLFRDQLRHERDALKSPRLAPSTPILRDYLTGWLQTYAIPNCKRSTAISYLWIINKYWLPTMGHLQLKHITIEHLKQLLQTLLAANKSRQTIRNILAPGREALNHALAEGLIPTNPVHAIAPHLKQIRDPKRYIHPLTRQQSTELLNEAHTLHPTLHLAIMLALYTGLRRGELLGLQWADINLTTNHATIRRARVWGHLTTPKNHQLRVVDLPPVLVLTLKPFVGLPDHHLLAINGTPISDHWFRQKFARAAIAAKLPTLHLHALRHTYASNLIALGANPKYIQAQMGHSTVSVTFDVYGHLFKTERFVDQLE